MAAILGGKNFWDILEYLDTLQVKHFNEIALSRTVKELKKILCFADFAKNLKIQNGRPFLRENILWIF